MTFPHQRPQAGMPMVPMGSNGLKTLQLIDQSHGHVIPRPDGKRASCAGLNGCWTCHMEHLVYESRNNLFVDQGMVIKPGDKILLIGPREIDSETAKTQIAMLQNRFPGTEFTIVAGYTGVQVANTDG